MSSNESTTKEQILQLELEMSNAMLHGDVATLGRLFAEDFAVNNPLNQIFDRQQVLDAVAAGRINHMELESEFELIRIHGDVVVVMGSERVVDSGPEFGRRYTNLWMKKDGRWQLFGRHAHVVAPSEAGSQP